MTVSVIIPVYNSEECIGRALTSVIRQTKPPLEIIVADDCSTDNTRAVVRAFSERWPTIKLLEMNRNRGPSAARNAAIAVAHGDWIAVLDGDDEWLPNRLEVLQARAERHRADVLADNLILYDQQAGREGRTAYSTGWQNKQITITDLVRSDISGPYRYSYGFLKPLIRRQFLFKTGIKYDEDLRKGGDFYVYAEMLFQGASFWLIDAAYYKYTTPMGEFSRRPSILQKTNAPFSALLMTSDRIDKNYAHLINGKLACLLQRRRMMIWANHITNIDRDLRRSGKYLHSFAILSSNPAALWLVSQRALHKVFKGFRSLHRAIPRGGQELSDNA